MKYFSLLRRTINFENMNFESKSFWSRQSLAKLFLSWNNDNMSKQIN